MKTYKINNRTGYKRHNITFWIGRKEADYEIETIESKVIDPSKMKSGIQTIPAILSVRKKGYISQNVKAKLTVDIEIKTRVFNGNNIEDLEIKFVSFKHNEMPDNLNENVDLSNPEFGKMIEMFESNEHK